MDPHGHCGDTREILCGLQAAQDDARVADLSGLSHYCTLFELKANVRGLTSRT